MVRVDRCDLLPAVAAIRPSAGLTAQNTSHSPSMADSRYTSNFSDPSRRVPLIDARSMWQCHSTSARKAPPASLANSSYLVSEGLCLGRSVDSTGSSGPLGKC